MGVGTREAMMLPFLRATVCLFHSVANVMSYTVLRGGRANAYEGVRVRNEGGEHERSELVHNKGSRAWRRGDGTRGKLRQPMTVLNVVGLTSRSGGLPHRNTAERTQISRTPSVPA